jgi:hypothetical protein
MSFANISVLNVVTDKLLPAAGVATAELTLTGVTAGSLLLITGSYYISGGVSANLLSVADTQSNTWSNINNFRPDGIALVFSAIAMNATAGNTTITATFTSHANSRRIAWAAFEIGGALTASAIDQLVTNTSPSGSTSTSVTTAALAQTDNLLIFTHGTWTNSSGGAPSGWTSHLTHANGVDGIIGTQISSRQVTSTAGVTAAVTHSTTGTTNGAQIIVLKAALASSIRYRFELDDTTLTSSDTGITGFVWRNGSPSSVLAEEYTGLSGDATAGRILITAIPVGVSLGDSITGAFYNTTDHSMFVTGVVEAV